jgi:ribulose-phosphate 3-epimerase
MDHVAAHLLSADLTCLADEVRRVVEAGVDRIHLEVLDDRELPRLAVGPAQAQGLRRHMQRREGRCWVPLDVHLRVQPAQLYAQAFAEAGAESIAFHPGATEMVATVEALLRLVRVVGCKSALAFDPQEPLGALERSIDQVDQVLIVCAHAGFGRTPFKEPCLRKIERARKLIDASGRDIRLVAAGGIQHDTIRRVAEAGADTFVAGRAIFGQQDYAAAISALRAEVHAPLARAA